MRTGIAVRALGIPVKMKFANSLSGIITGICLRGDGSQITYEISYFNEREYKQIWMVESEFEVTQDPSYATIGFLNGRTE